MEENEKTGYNNAYNLIAFKEIIMKSLKWYTIASCIWIFIFPITGITGWAFMISGPIAIVGSIVKFVFKLLGIELSWLTKSSLGLGVLPDLIISVIVGFLLTIIGIWLWRITKRLYQWLVLIKPENC